jgi:uncharacterized repeat protein (TIGR04042 family)
MPELRFVLRWPDGKQEVCYSPSTVIRNHFAVGATYPMADFLSRTRVAMRAASDRVQAVHGAPCSLALGQLARIEASAARHPTDAIVIFESFEE